MNYFRFRWRHWNLVDGATGGPQKHFSRPDKHTANARFWYCQHFPISVPVLQLYVYRVGVRHADFKSVVAFNFAELKISPTACHSYGYVIKYP
jgi:hypothetical protein